MYPNIGPKILVSYNWQGKQGQVIGTLQSVARVRSGAVMGFIKTDTGKIVGVPWSTSYSKFEVIG